MQFETAPDAMLVVDAGGRIIHANAQIQPLFGWAREDLIGQPVEILVPKHNSEKHARLRTFYSAQPRTRLMDARPDLRAVRKDGTEFPVEISLSPLPSKGGPLIVAAIRDVSARRQAEKALAASRESLAEAQRIAHIGSWVWDIREDHFTWSDELYRIFGVDPQRFEATYEALVRCVPAEERDALNVAVRHCRETCAPLDYVHRVIRPDGTTRYVHAKGRVEVDENGTPVCMMGTCQDITERRLAELEAQRHAEALARSNAELEQFAYVASHDLQEPLRTVASFVNLLARRYRGRLDREADEFIAFTLEGAERMQRLILDLLAYSRVTSRGRPFEPVDVGRVLQGVLADVHGAIVECGATVTVGPLPTIEGDASQLAQLFQNLICNALKFRSAAPPRVEVSAARCGDTHTFSVRDNGIGIDPKFYPRLFAIFQRLHTRNEYSGSGIGLAICKKIVERHGGRIWMEPADPGPGSVFRFSLPTSARP